MRFIFCPSFWDAQAVEITKPKTYAKHDETNQPKRCPSNEVLVPISMPTFLSIEKNTLRKSDLAMESIYSIRLCLIAEEFTETFFWMSLYKLYIEYIVD